MGKADYDDRYEKHLRAGGVANQVLAREGTTAARGSVVLYEVRVKLDADEGTSCLAILKGTREDGLVVGFVGAPDYETVMIAVGKKLAKDAVRWREDRPWRGNGD